ncbi:MAG: secretin N-terminal domain-containing protein [Candidatus Omnitrophota bacterium]
MKIFFKGLFIVLFNIVLVILCFAEPVSPPVLTTEPQPKVSPLVEGIQGTISLDLRKINIDDALKYFSLKSGLNIVTTKSVTGRVTLVVKDVPVQDVFDIMLRSNGLAYDKIGDIYNVMSQDEYKVIYGKRFSDIREVKVFRLNYAMPEQAFSMLDTMKSDIGRILVDQETGTVLCMDSPEKLEQMEAVMKEFEKENITRIFQLNYAKALEVEGHLRTQLNNKNVGSIRADERSNQVIVQAFPERMKEVRRLIEALDVKTKEVLIDAKILKINLDDSVTTGIKWEGLFDVSEKKGLTYIGSTPFTSVQATTDDWRSRQQVLNDVGNVGSYPFSGTTSNYSSGQSSIGIDKMHIGMIGAHDFDVTLQYLKTVTEAKILSNPKIAVVNNQEARIHVGERQAYVTTTTTSGQSTSTISEEVNFIDIGIQMDVVPTINEDGFISIKLKSEVSSVISVLITPTENQIPIIDTSLAETTVLVKEGATIVIGGLRKEEKTKYVQRVPILSKIPLFGLLFQNKTDGKTITELLIMITPTIITGETLIASESKEVGLPNIKPAQQYEDVERIKKEQETFMPPPPESNFGGMQLKGAKAYKNYEGFEDSQNKK